MMSVKKLPALAFGLWPLARVGSTHRHVPPR
jgi:hypothetical protein